MGSPAKTKDTGREGKTLHQTKRSAKENSGNSAGNLNSPEKCDKDPEHLEEETEETFGDVAGSSPRAVHSNDPSIRDEHQPSIQLSDCPPGRGDETLLTSFPRKDEKYENSVWEKGAS